MPAHPDVYVEPLAVSPRQAAVRLGVSHATVYNLLNAGQIRSVKCGARRLIALDELRRYLAEAAR